MMSVTAYFGTRCGGSGARTIKDAAEAEKILRGGYSVTNVHLEDCDGNTVGARWRDHDGERWRWLWYYDQEAFK